MKFYDKFQNLIVMAIADGNLSEGEIRFLSERCKRWGMSDHEFGQAIEYALRADAILTIPTSHDERVDLLKELIQTMAADGELAEIEKQLFAVAAARMELPDGELGKIIDSIL